MSRATQRLAKSALDSKPGRGRATSQPSHAGHGDPRLHLLINLIHLLATAGAVIETAREVGEWLHFL